MSRNFLFGTQKTVQLKNPKKKEESKSEEVAQKQQLNTRRLPVSLSVVRLSVQTAEQ